MLLLSRFSIAQSASRANARSISQQWLAADTSCLSQHFYLFFLAQGGVVHLIYS